MTRQRAFTLLEVMLALALVGVGLTVLLRSVANDMFAAQEAQMIGVVTDLSRSKIYDLEERMLQDGFTDTDQSDAGNFENEGWPSILWAAKVDQVELPSWDELQKLAKGQALKQAAGSGLGSAFGAQLMGSNAGSALSSSLGASVADQLGSAFGSSLLPTDFSQLGSDAFSTFQNSALGGMLTQFGGLGGIGGTGASDATSGAGALVIQSQYTMVQNVLKVSIRKVTLLVKYQIAGHDRDLTTVVYFTDPASMDKVLNGLGAQDIGSGAGSGSGSGSTTTTTGSNGGTAGVRTGGP
jgi:prepilin-type N-terminal cleavage/methylation domain-containing protein